MRAQVYLSPEMVELAKYLSEEAFKVDMIEGSMSLVQVEINEIPTLYFIFDLSEEAIKFLKEIVGKKAFVNIKSTGISSAIPTLLIEMEIEYIEVSSLKDFSLFLDEIHNHASKPKNDYLMLQRQEETFKPNQVWIKFLSCIPGISLAKAEAICKIYPSFTHLLLAYSKCPEKKRGNMLKQIPTGSVSIGKVISKKIYSYINAEDPRIVL
jgi:ERCC4-type nuclease